MLRLPCLGLLQGQRSRAPARAAAPALTAAATASHFCITAQACLSALLTCFTGIC